MALQLPSSTQISFSDETIRKAAEGPKLPEGYHLFVIKKAEAAVSESDKIYGSIVLKLECVALADHNDVNSGVRPSMRLQVTLPLDNPNVEGHAAPVWAADMASRFFCAVDDTIPAMPVKENGVWTFKGEELGKDGYNAAKTEVYAAAFEAARDALADPTTLVGRAFYGEVGCNKTGYYGILTTKAELPEGVECVQLSTK